MTSNKAERIFHVAPTMLCCDPLELRPSIEKLNTLGVDWFHLDVMDGHFVPNLALGIDYMKAMIKAFKFPAYVHMMVESPERFISPMASIGVKFLAFHYEATKNPFRICQMIKDEGMDPCIAINPSTPVAVLEPLIDRVRCITLLGVEPGFSGQQFLRFTIDKISELKKMIGKTQVLIEMDGGADIEISAACLHAGADVIVGGAFTIFNKAHSIEENYRQLVSRFD